MADCANCADCPFDGQHQYSADLFEIHITVDSDRVTEFRQLCEQHQVKTVLIAFQTDNGPLTHLMTSDRHIGNIQSARQRAAAIAELLTSQGFDVVRTKIEAAITNQADPTEINRTGYFEAHLAVTIGSEQRDQLAEHTSSVGLRLSRNPFKDDGSTAVYMATARQFTIDKDRFLRDVGQQRQALIERGYSVDRVITEYAIDDSRLQLDDQWK